MIGPHQLVALVASAASRVVDHPEHASGVGHRGDSGADYDSVGILSFESCEFLQAVRQCRELLVDECGTRWVRADAFVDWCCMDDDARRLDPKSRAVWPYEVDRVRSDIYDMDSIHNVHLCRSYIPTMPRLVLVDVKSAKYDSTYT